MKKWALMSLSLALALVVSGPASAAVTMGYANISGDVSSGIGVLGITCAGSSGDLWELKLTRTATDFLVTGFDDRTDTGSFNYANNGSLTNGMFKYHAAAAGSGNDQNVVTFTETHRGNDYYGFRVSEAHSYIMSSVLTRTFDAVTDYKFYAADTGGTRFEAIRTFVNVKGTVLNYQQTSGGFQLAVGLNLTNNYDGDVGTGAAYSLSAYDANGYRTQVQTSNPSVLGIYKETDNFDRESGANPNYAQDVDIHGEFEVVAGDAASTLGLVVGRTITIDSDNYCWQTGTSTITYYTGDIAMNTASQYNYDQIQALQSLPRWQKLTNMPIGYTETRTSTLDMNIAVPEPATMGLLGLGLIGMLTRRRNSK